MIFSTLQNHLAFSNMLKDILNRPKVKELLLLTDSFVDVLFRIKCPISLHSVGYHSSNVAINVHFVSKLLENTQDTGIR